MRLFCLLFVCFVLVVAKHEFYDGYSIYEVSVNAIDQVILVNGIGSKLDLDIWAHALPNRPGTVLVAGDKRKQFENELSAVGAEFKIISENVKELLELEEKMMSDASRKSYKSFNATKSNGFSFDRIYTYSEINTYLEMLAEAHPHTVTLVNAGKSFQGRDIKYLKISTTKFQDQSKPIVFLESLLHAREWVTLPATLYAIQKLVLDVTEQDLLHDIDWIILPVANPDGYVHTHVVNRFWRKNRADGYMINNFCTGVDLNRNFGVFWSETSSSNVCTDTFHGRGPFSEPETATIRDIFQQHKDRIELFIDIHSFGSMILYGYGNGQLPSNGLHVHLGGVQMAAAIDAVKMSWNDNYIVGNVALVLYKASGSAMDYAISIGVPYGYTYELPGYRFGLGGFGFLVDPAFIEQAGFETWQGIEVGARNARHSYRLRREIK